MDELEVEVKKEIKTEITKEKIMIAAMEEFGSKGYDVSSLNSICTASGVSKGLLYHNFKSKDELYLTCVEKCFSDLVHYLKNTDIKDLQHYMELRIQYFSEHALYTRIFFEAVLRPPVKLSQEIKELKKDLDALNKQIYSDVISTIRLRDNITKTDAIAYFEIIQGVFNGYFSSTEYLNANLSDIAADHEKQLAKTLDMILYGVTERSTD